MSAALIAPASVTGKPKVKAKFPKPKLDAKESADTKEKRKDIEGEYKLACNFVSTQTKEQDRKGGGREERKEVKGKEIHPRGY